MKIVIIDGQGGRLGSLLTERIKASGIDAELYAVGTNSTATASMLKAGAGYGATGENPVIVNCRDADFIVGPIGILSADSLLGEVTAPMAAAVARSAARKVLLPYNKCGIIVAGMADLPLGRMIEEAVAIIRDAAGR